MNEIRREYRAIIGTTPLEEFEAIKRAYERISAFENERGISTKEMQKEVEKITEFENKRGMHINEIKKRIKLLTKLEKRKEEQLNRFRNIKNVYNAGVNEGRAKYGICFYCSVCGYPDYILPNTEIHSIFIQYLKNQGWGHSVCHEREKTRREQYYRYGEHTLPEGRY